MQSGALAFRTQTAAVTVATEFQSLHVWDADRGELSSAPWLLTCQLKTPRPGLPLRVCPGAPGA